MDLDTRTVFISDVHPRSVRYGAGDKIVVDESDDDGVGHRERTRGLGACENNVVNAVCTNFHRQ